MNYKYLLNTSNNKLHIEHGCSYAEDNYIKYMIFDSEDEVKKYTNGKYNWCKMCLYYEQNHDELIKKVYQERINPEKETRQIEQKNKILKYQIKMPKWIISIFLIVVLCLMFVNGFFFKELKEEDICNVVIEKIKPQVEDIANIAIDVELDELKIEKPTIFAEGYISAKITPILKSDSFNELESGNIDINTFNKYYKIADSIEFNYFNIKNYSINYKKISDCNIEFKDSANNRYVFEYSPYYREPQVWRNGYLIFEQKKENAFNEENECKICFGTGVVKVQYGNRWNDDEGYKNGGKCGNCNGTGYK